MKRETADGHIRQATKIIGTPALRKEGVGKVAGSARYIDDIRSTARYRAQVAANLPQEFLQQLAASGAEQRG